MRIVPLRYMQAGVSPAMVARPIMPDVFEDWIEMQKEKPVRAKPGFIAEKKI